MSKISLAQAFNPLAEPVPSDVPKPTPEATKPPATVPQAVENPTIGPPRAPGVSMNQGAHSILRSGPVKRMQEEILRVYKEFITDKVSSKGNTLPWDNFITSIFQRHIDHTAGKSTKPFVDLWSSLSKIGKITQDNQGNSIPIADGSWGDKTNQALHSLSTLGSMITSLAAKFDIPIHFSSADVENLNKLIPSDTSKATNETANEITEILHKITDSVGKFIGQIENITSNKRDNGELDAGYGDQADKYQELVARFPQLNTLNLSGIAKDPSSPKPQVINEPLNLLNLTNPELFKKFIKDNGISLGAQEISNDNQLSEFLTYLENGVSNGTIKVSKTPPSPQQQAR